MIPNRIVRVLRGEERRVDPRKRLHTKPLSWVASRLAKEPGAVESLLDQLNGRYIATYRDPCSSVPVFCCGGHRKSGRAFDCVKEKRARVVEFFAFIPLVGFYRSIDGHWELVDNLLTNYSSAEQLKTIEDLSPNTRRVGKVA